MDLTCLWAVGWLDLPPCTWDKFCALDPRPRRFRQPKNFLLLRLRAKRIFGCHWTLMSHHPQGWRISWRFGSQIDSIGFMDKDYYFKERKMRLPLKSSRKLRWELIYCHQIAGERFHVFTKTFSILNNSTIHYHQAGTRQLCWHARAMTQHQSNSFHSQLHAQGAAASFLGTHRIDLVSYKPPTLRACCQLLLILHLNSAQLDLHPLLWVQQAI